MAEECGVLVGVRIGGTWLVTRQTPASGSAVGVEADWAWALEREETDGDVMGFWHTHPPGEGVSPSERDSRTMRAWCSALGKPQLCLIADGERLGGQVFADEEVEGQPVRMIEWLGRDAWRVA